MWLHSILTSVLEEGACSPLQSVHYPPGGRAFSKCSTEDRVGPSAGLDIWKKGQFFACNGVYILRFPIQQPSSYKGSFFFLHLQSV